MISHIDSQIVTVRDRRELMGQDLASELDRHFLSLPTIGQIMPDAGLVTGFMAAIEEKERHRNLLLSATTAPNRPA